MVLSTCNVLHPTMLDGTGVWSPLWQHHFSNTIFPVTIDKCTSVTTYSHTVNNLLASGQRFYSILRFSEKPVSTPEEVLDGIVDMQCSSSYNVRWYWGLESILAAPFLKYPLLPHNHR
ncbi:hypothetical protein TNIN_14541 [Trichonephila inaurata madagascariensis]|uniref:Uncharacterized protein n=1 Tax=Trichonephila inaurata madagascariensis TaxID=2747483 RepID=A0A8X6XGB1_9ARAC|nr:hypothetical protein TNIN_14541 [Trichonephila inaurata madagascariensis]